MKKFFLLLASGMLAAGFAVFATAGGYDQPAMDMGKMKGDCTGMDKMKSGCIMMDKNKNDCMAMEKMKCDCMTIGGHNTTGTVDNIEYSQGVLTLKSGGPDMTLQFPPASIKDLKNGDTITVNLGFSKGMPVALD